MTAIKIKSSIDSEFQSTSGYIYTAHIDKEYFSDISCSKDNFFAKEFVIWSQKNTQVKIVKRWGRLQDKQEFEFFNTELK